MAKDPTPNADRLRQQREEKYGHLQATAETPAGYVAGASAGGPQPAPKPRRLIPYAGQPKGDTGRTPKAPVDQSPQAKEARSAMARKRVKRKRRTELPPEGTAR